VIFAFVVAICQKVTLELFGLKTFGKVQIEYASAKPLQIFILVAKL